MENLPESTPPTPPANSEPNEEARDSKTPSDHKKPSISGLSKDSSYKTKISPIILCMDDRTTSGVRDHPALTRELSHVSHRDRTTTSDNVMRRTSVKGSGGSRGSESGARLSQHYADDRELGNVSDSDYIRRLPEARTSRILTAVDSADLQRTRSIIEHHRRTHTQVPEKKEDEDKEILLERVLAQKQVQLVIAQMRAADAQRYAANAMTRYYEQRTRRTCVIM